MKYMDLHKILSIRPYAVLNGPVPSSRNLRSFMSDNQYPQKVNGWVYGFIPSKGRSTGRVTSNFVAQVAHNISSLKITNGQVERMTVPQKRLEMVALSWHRDGFVEVVGAHPRTTTLMFSLIKKKYDLAFKRVRNSQNVLDKLYKSSVLIRRLQALAEIGKQRIFVGLSSGEKLRSREVKSIFPEKRTLRAVGGMIPVNRGKVISFTANHTGTNLLYSTKDSKVGWKDIASFMDDYIYPNVD